ncbi:hypothetical protein [Candidatus Magnetobacterium casense]|uniref:Uncharacterized protein n=1 Tax=Candidatus Magnetobacterium casense TaxID=1455061 RepID=A0ABS6S217_9BACT|nr:hypothetical protein [Candidatus Magnetobacterium casensis]MBV6342443.1 hypothetical protein [Candidatus Magnetobacterium casensis]
MPNLECILQRKVESISTAGDGCDDGSMVLHKLRLGFDDGTVLTITARNAKRFRVAPCLDAKLTKEDS